MMQNSDRLVSIPSQQAHDLDALLASGRFTSESDVLGQALRLLREQVDETEDWLVKEVLPVIRAMRADPARGISVDRVGETLKDLHRKRAVDVPHD